MTVRRRDLADFRLSEKEETNILGIISGSVDPETVSKTAAGWVRQCYHRPSDEEIAMCAIDDLLGTHGVEAIEVEDEIVFEYCNTGDSYAATVIDDRRNREFLVCGWADLMEDL